MKKSTSFMILMCLSGLIRAQNFVADFELFPLSPNSYYSSTSSTPFQTLNASFEYKWDPSFGGFWSGGFSYTNKYDSVNGSFGNLYGVQAYKGYTNSSTYVVGQDRSTVKVLPPFTDVNGFYITNTTYTYKSIRNGNQFSRKFGDTTGTGSGTTIPQGSYPDFFKITAKGFKNGTMKADSVVFFLADYRFANNAQDYAVKTWEWFDLSQLKQVDSIRFFMYSSDLGSFGINTPLFFAMDNFSTAAPNPVGISGASSSENYVSYPNPVTKVLTVGTGLASPYTLRLMTPDGKEVLRLEGNQSISELDMENLQEGLYFLELSTSEFRSVKRVIKQ